jgi:pimeloyl-ACP methyl ester carboxylesterase
MFTLGGCLSFQSGPSTKLDAAQRVVVPGRGQLRVLDWAPTGESYAATSGGEAVVLVHGYGSSMKSYLPVVPDLRRHHRVIAVDLPGFGFSDRRPGDYSAEALADVLVQILEQKQLGRVHLVGHSWGASIALAFALRHPERLARLVVISGWLYEEQILPFMRWARLPGLGESLFAVHYTQQMGEKIYFNFYDPKWVTNEMVDEVVEITRRPGTVAAALAAARGMHFVAREQRHKEIDHEALLVWGAEDRVAHPVFGERLARELPHARLVLIPACGHIPMIECQGPTAAALTDFLDRAAP